MSSRPARLASALPAYARIAWWGLAAPRVAEREPLVVHQAAVIGEEGLLLAVRAELRGWELPGGAGEPDEVGEESLRREVREETGLELADVRLVAEYERTGFRPHTARIYRAAPAGGSLRPSPETPLVRWFAPDDLPSASIFPWFRGPIADALAPPPGAPVLRREHQGPAAILAGMAIDLRMRWSDDRAD